MSRTDATPRLWRRHLCWTVLLLLLWFCISFGVVWLARSWQFSVFGSPFVIWIAGQGALLMFLAIVWFYVRIGDAHDRAIDDDAAGRG